MFEPPTKLIDPRHAADAALEFTGTLPLARMVRLGDVLRENKGDVKYHLIFSRDAEGRGLISGTISARLELNCQRCLEAMTQVLELHPHLALVAGMDEASLLPDELDPLLVTEELIALPDIIEDELVLALPQIPMHDPGDCPSGEGGAEVGVVAGESQGIHPFAILGALKRGPG